MFTGIIQGLGTIKSLQGNFWQINFINQSKIIAEDLALGDSVAVNGICLTVEEILHNGFVATASPETIDRTTLGIEETQQIYVNLEASLKVGGKVGGHFVMGHVDGIGQLKSVVETASSWEMTFTIPQAIARYIVSKGSIAINGISLTIAHYHPDNTEFTVAVIPVTYRETNLSHLVTGSWVNLESDILGKYVEKFITSHHNSNQYPEKSVEITPAFLAENGYL